MTDSQTFLSLKQVQYFFIICFMKHNDELGKQPIDQVITDSITKTASLHTWYLLF